MSLRPIGWHDDSFAFATVAPPNWHFTGRLAKFKGLDKWQTQPIGGEIRPEVWGCVFDDPPCVLQGQQFEKCVAATHVSWLMDSGMFRERPNAKRLARATAMVCKMGYEFYVPDATLQPTQGGFSIKLALRNTGVAPFYYNWPVEIGVLSHKGKLVETWPAVFKITGILPDQPDSVFNFELKDVHLSPGQYHVLLRVKNPLPSGVPVRFANQTQDADLSGWLTLGELELN